MKAEAIGRPTEMVFLGTLLILCPGSWLYVCPEGLGRTLFGLTVLLPSQTSSKATKRIPGTFYLRTVPPCKIKYAQLELNANPCLNQDSGQQHN
jgi:hypothetical protein